MCDIKILLDIPYEVRKQRAMERDGITEEAFALRDQASLNYDLSDFEYIFTDNDEENVRKLVKII